MFEGFLSTSTGFEWAPVVQREIFQPPESKCQASALNGLTPLAYLIRVESVLHGDHHVNVLNSVPSCTRGEAPTGPCGRPGNGVLVIYILVIHRYVSSFGEVFVRTNLHHGE